MQASGTVPNRIVVVAGPASSGKMPLARRLLAGDPTLVLVHRDHLRTSFENSALDEWQITLLMSDVAEGILHLQLSPLVVAWNMHPADKKLWTTMANAYDAPLEWLDVREPHVAAMIPPLPVHADG
jgi:predicted kinase